MVRSSRGSGRPIKKAPVAASAKKADPPEKDASTCTHGIACRFRLKCRLKHSDADIAAFREEEKLRLRLAEMKAERQLARIKQLQHELEQRSAASRRAPAETQGDSTERNTKAQQPVAPCAPQNPRPLTAVPASMKCTHQHPQIQAANGIDNKMSMCSYCLLNAIPDSEIRRQGKDRERVQLMCDYDTKTHPQNYPALVYELQHMLKASRHSV